MKSISDTQRQAQICPKCISCRKSCIKDQRNLLWGCGWQRQADTQEVELLEIGILNEYIYDINTPQLCISFSLKAKCTFQKVLFEGMCVSIHTGIPRCYHCGEQ